MKMESFKMSVFADKNHKPLFALFAPMGRNIFSQRRKGLLEDKSSFTSDKRRIYKYLVNSFCI